MFSTPTTTFCPEILAPAGQMDKLKTACRYGADAVYLGGPRYGLRSGADNFSHEELTEAAEFAASYGVKIYVTLNAFLHEHDLDGLPEYVQFLESVGVSGLIISDPGVMSIAKRHCNIPLHVSTQASCINEASAKLWKELGAVRIITGRELSVEEGARLARAVDMEVEMFIHGAMCSAYSGHCTISNYTAGRDSNRGGCKQSCRFVFDVNGGAQSTLMSSKDLNGLKLAGEFSRHRIDSLKIEGRMKSCLYVASCCKAYREALDAILAHEPIPERCQKELESFSHRGYTEASLGGVRAGADSIMDQRNEDEGLRCSWIGHVVSVDELYAYIQLKNPVQLGEVVEVMTFRGENILLNTQELISFDGRVLTMGKQESVLRVARENIEVGMMLRKGTA
jgi:U32 family peptidase